MLLESPDVLVDAANISEKCWDKHVHPPSMFKCALREFAIAWPQRPLSDRTCDPAAYGDALLRQ